MPSSRGSADAPSGVSSSWTRQPMPRTPQDERAGWLTLRPAAGPRSGAGGTRWEELALFLKVYSTSLFHKSIPQVYSRSALIERGARVWVSASTRRPACPLSVWCFAPLTETKKAFSRRPRHFFCSFEPTERYVMVFKHELDTEGLVRAENGRPTAIRLLRNHGLQENFAALHAA